MLREREGRRFPRSQCEKKEKTFNWSARLAGFRCFVFSALFIASIRHALSHAGRGMIAVLSLTRSSV